MKLALGTVQFGMPYGIANEQHVPADEEIASILDLAELSAIDAIDTASSYGDSETRLGAALRGRRCFRLVTKTPPLNDDESSLDPQTAVRASLLKSLARLRQPAIYALLVHRASDLFAPGGDNMLKGMHECAREGLVSKLGVSVYCAEDIDRVLGCFVPDVVQLPLNVFDQRLCRSGHLQKLSKLGVEIHARSIFLQGLLLMSAEEIPARFASMRAHVDAYHSRLGELGITPLEAALGFVEQCKDITYGVIGVISALQLAECTAAARKVVKFDFGDFAFDRPEFVDPRLWSE